MALSIFTNPSAMGASNSLSKSNNALSTAMERLGTGKRINSAADDAAGLQIATRLQAQSNGMAVAQRNISDGVAMLQTAEGAFDEVTNILHRMKDLSTQAANGTNSAADSKALSAEFGAMAKELTNIMENTRYGGEDLFGKSKLGSKVTLQIGASAGEVMEVDVSKMLGEIKTELKKLDKAEAAAGGGTEGGTEGGTGEGAQQASRSTSAGLIDTTTQANSMITTLATTIDNVSGMRSSLGASINRLGHTSANLANMQDNTNVAMGNIMDADFAKEASNMTRNQMLAQTSMSMLKQSNSMSGMVMSLLG